MKKKLTVNNMSLIMLLSVIIGGIAIFSIYNFDKTITKYMEHNNKIIEQVISKIDVKCPTKKCELSIDKNTLNVLIYKQDFKDKYFETQSYWLNFWLTCLTILISIVGVALPLFTAKSHENQEKELNNVIRESKRKINASVENTNENTKKSLKYALLSQASIQMMLRKWNKAIEFYLELLDNDDKDIETLTNITQAYICAEKFLEAKKYSLKILRLDKDNCEGLNSLLYINLITKDIKHAVECGEKILNIEPENLICSYNLIEAYILNNDLDKAVNLFEKYREFQGSYILFKDINYWKNIINQSKGIQENKDKLNNFISELVQKGKIRYDYIK